MSSHTAHRAITLAVAFLIVLSGCQSGWVGVLQVSDDGWVLAFDDARNDGIYVADHERVRRIAPSGEFVLSPRGNLLLVLRRRAKHRAGYEYQTGDEITLHDLQRNKEYSSTLRFNIAPSLLVDPNERSPYAFQNDNLKNEVDVRTLPKVQVYFSHDGDSVMIGPIWGEYWKWDYSEPHDKWEWLSPLEVDAFIDQSDARPIRSRNSGEDAYVIPIPSDGLTALHTVWVRPDGSVIELLRKNDAPMLFSLAIGATVFSPACAIVAFTFSPGTLGQRASYAVEQPALWFGFSWLAATSDLEVDREAVIRAREAVHIAIAIRRHGPQRAPEPLPPADE